MTVTSCVGCVQEGPDNSLPPKARDQAGVLSRNEGAICTSKLPKLKKNLGDYHIFSMLKEYKLVLIKKKKKSARSGRKEVAASPPSPGWCAAAGGSLEMSTGRTHSALCPRLPVRRPCACLHSLFPSPSLPQPHVSWPRLGRLAHPRPRLLPRVCPCVSVRLTECGFGGQVRLGHKALAPGLGFLSEA